MTLASTCRNIHGQPLQSAMARYSVQSIAALTNMLRGKDVKKQPSGALKRAAQQALGPFRHCFKCVALPCKHAKEDAIQFMVADLRRLLDHVARQCDSVEEALTASPDGKLQAFLAHDEATAGNVLNPKLRQKVLLFYVSFQQLQACRDSARAWLPVSAITHEQLEGLRGGIAEATAAFLRSWSEDNLLEPFPIGKSQRQVTVALKLFISDLDSQRAALAAKGSAALKPCIFCSNCIARYAGDACADATFHTVEQHDFSQFVPYSRNELEACILHWLGRVETMSRAERDIRERCLGYNLEKHSLWSCPASRALLHINMIQNDCLHCYWSNGICSSEVILLLKVAQVNLGVTVNGLAQACVNAGWSRHDKSENKFWLKRLWKEALFGEGVYKGSAGETVALVALLRYIAETQWLQVPAMSGPVKCFLQLCRCTDALKRCKADLEAAQCLHREQQEHQRLFSQQYPNCSRPKHHCRLHLPGQYLAHGVAASCWGVESAHKSYKGVYADLTRQFLRSDNGGLSLSQELLPRLLLRSIELLKELPILSCGYELQDPFSEAEVLAATQIEGAQIAKKCRLNMVSLQEADYLLTGERYTEGCQIHFFLRKHGRLFLFVTVLALIKAGESFRIFQKTAEKKFIEYACMNNMHIPAWTAAESGTVMFLP